MEQIILVVHVLLAVGVIGLVLIQQGKGADAGAAFGSGASGTVFGSKGSGSFMTRITTLLAALFFVTSMTLFYLAANRDRGGLGSIVDGLVTEQAPSVVDHSGEMAPPVAPEQESEFAVPVPE